jgi:hypothetical protein
MKQTKKTKGNFFPNSYVITFILAAVVMFFYFDVYLPKHDTAIIRAHPTPTPHFLFFPRY